MVKSQHWNIWNSIAEKNIVAYNPFSSESGLMNPFFTKALAISL